LDRPSISDRRFLLPAAGLAILPLVAAPALADEMPAYEGPAPDMAAPDKTAIAMPLPEAAAYLPASDWSLERMRPEPAIAAFAGQEQDAPAAGETAELSAAPVQGPPAPAPDRPFEARERPSFGGEFNTVKWETAAILAYMTITQAIVTKEVRSFHFQDEGWFGKNTKTLGMDKLTHAFNAYILADFLQHRIEKRTGGPDGSGAVTAALVSGALQFYSELWDAHKLTSGFSMQDIAFNTLGAGFSAIRNSVPGLRDKLDFRLLLIPNSDIYTFKGQRHYAQQRYLFALTLSGFEGLKDSPLRFVELHAGYYGRNFMGRDKALGRAPEHRLFFGVGLNLKELFFRAPRSRPGRWAGSGLDYIQLPYTAVHIH
jgi:hypothetical protein